MSDSPKSKPKWRWVRIILTIIICLGIISASVAAVVVINQTEPTAQKIESTRKSAALVETMTVQRGAFSPQIVVLGSVEPASDVILSPRVSGQVLLMGPKLVPGGMIKKGDLLLKIDPADFENAVSIKESELQQTQASLKIEEGRQSVAKQELALLEGTIQGADRELVLREPQIASIRAEVSAAEAAVQRAKLDLERTEIFAPFDAHVMSRSVNVGSQVRPGDELARLVGVEEYWIMASVPIRHLKWIQFQDKDQRGSEVILRNSDSWPAGVTRTGTVARMIGTLDPQTRLASVLITVQDPLSLESDAPPLILETLMETHITGRTIEDVIQLNREHIHEGDTVWVMKDGKLEIRRVEIVFRDGEDAYIQSGLSSGDEVVITNLATVAEGIGLRKAATTPIQTENSGEVLD
ncbi:efflux RND transporter periplasmic adaptor subunit [Thalassoglobus sp.]|uniref:efflux RND transporter periplasmic adaptor subunit n=1 Tax=Thalassoglobus sp. TaxID=2795869 RepID=UPI003AA7AB2E